MSAPKCTSRGPRSDGEGTPVCGRNRGHYGKHEPHADDGWDAAVRWPNRRDVGPEQFVVIYTLNPYGASRAEGPLTEEQAFARRNALYDEERAQTVSIVEWERSPDPEDSQ